MATKAWIENEYVFVTTDVSVAPSDAIDVPDGITPQDLVIDNGVLRLKTEQEKLQDLKQRKLQELKQYVANLLSRTDWVIIKLQSLRDEGWSDTEIQAEMQKYAGVLAQRKAIREWNLQMEQAIQNAQSIEELEGVKIEFTG